jgi:hypothetical protein
LINFLNKRFPKDNYPPILIHIYYILISITFCYLYYHKFIVKADFYGNESSGGIYAVLNSEAIKPAQYRLLVPYIFKVVQSGFFIFHSIPDKALFFLLTILFCYLILLSFYFLLNEYFKSKATNCWLAPIIIYPMVWNFVIMNGQFFFMDFTVLLIIILGIYAIVSRQNGWLIFIFLFGVINHPSVGFLIPAYLLFNYNRLLKVKTIIYAAVMCLLFSGIIKIMDVYFSSNKGYFVIFNLPRNLGIADIIPVHIIIRDLLFNFGGLHLIILLFIFNGLWKRYKGPMLYINIVMIPYVISVLVNFSIEEIRNYIAIIPFVMITFLLFLSTFQNSFLKPVDRVFTGGEKN